MVDNKIPEDIEWKSVPDGKRYEASNYGHIRVAKTGQLLKPWIACGYRVFQLRLDDGKSHRISAGNLVKRAFDNEEKRPGMTLDHIDRNRSNDHISNLRYADKKTQSQNSSHPKHKFVKQIVQVDARDKTVVSRWTSQRQAIVNLPELQLSKELLSDALQTKKELRGFLWFQALEYDLGEKFNELEWHTPILPEKLNDVQPVVNFKVCRDGFILSDRGILSSGHKGDDGYRVHHFQINKKKYRIRVHQLICRTFNGPPETETAQIVDHINEVREDNRAENLQWVTQKENIQYHYDRKLQTQQGKVKYEVTAFSITDLKKVGTYSCVNAACRELLKKGIVVQQTSICGCLSNKFLSAGGFLWRRTSSLPPNCESLSELDKKSDTGKTRKKLIYVYSKETHTLIGEPSHQNECARQYNTTKNSIRCYASGKTMPPGDVYFSYDPPLSSLEQAEKFQKMFSNLPEGRKLKDESKKKHPERKQIVLKIDFEDETRRVEYASIDDFVKNNVYYGTRRDLIRKTIRGKEVIIKGKGENDFYLQYLHPSTSQLKPLKQPKPTCRYVCYSLDGKKLLENTDRKLLIEEVRWTSNLVEKDAKLEGDIVEKWIANVRQSFARRNSASMGFQWRKFGLTEEIPATIERSESRKRKRS